MFRTGLAAGAELAFGAACQTPRASGCEIINVSIHAPRARGRPRQKLNFAGFSALEAPKRCYYIKDYEPLMSKIDDFVVCYLYDVAENGKIFREPPGEIM